MIARNEIYACPHCGNIVEVLCGSNVTPSCCGSPMTLKKEGTSDGAAEKHVPVIEAIDGGYKVTVGSVPHPMEEKHYIQWIELLAGEKVLRQYLAPGDAPEAFFACTDKAVTAREYCNLHGHWAASKS